MESIAFPLVIGRSANEKVSSLTGGLGEYIVIVPSARWETKRWPAENFGRLISKLPLPCVITGNNADRHVVQQVLTASKNKGVDLCGRTGLRELTALIAGAKAVISNDSGPMHIAAALGIPVIALFGPTDPDKTGPYGWRHNRDLKVLSSSLHCIPCFRKKCKAPECMSGIKVDAVFEAVKEYL
ncbi:MAG TPA: glycosyltransferase family 9 protein [Nitrospirae bacterium]|nr:glycosyltransferase family 9 protein [Nitrospirota bacterium]